MRLSELIIDKIPVHQLLESYALPEMAQGDEKEISQEDWIKAMDMVKDHNNSPSIMSDIKGFYYIDVTGRWQVYFTLWRWKDIDPRFAGYIKNPIYMGNMTTNFLSSVEKALSRVPKTVKFQVMTEANREGLIGKNAAQNNEDIKFTFGKYRGKSLGEVYLEDPRYMAWLAQNQDPKYANTKLSVALQVFSQMYYEEVTKQNQEKYSNQQHFGKIGDWFEGELEVYKVAIKDGEDFRTGKPMKYMDARLKDASDNKFIVYNLDKSIPAPIEVGTKVAIRGKVKAHKEYLGIKFTQLGYVKPLAAKKKAPVGVPAV